MPSIEDLIGAIGGRLGSSLSAASPFQGVANRLGALSPFNPAGVLSGKSPFPNGLAAQSPFQNQALGGESPFAGRGFNVQSPFTGTLVGGTPFGGNPLTSNFNPYAPKPVPGPGQPGYNPFATGTTGGQAGTPSSGMEPAVARWADQMRSTFADLGADMPDVMLAIITNESHGDPNVQNHQGYPAYGLFQLWDQPGLNVDQQFQAAHKLAADKLKSLNDSYAAHGMNPDARTRARDFALAWGGHFNYATGLPNPSSADVGSGQSAQQLADVFLKNYDAIKAGRTQQATGGNSGVGTVPGWQNSITPGTPGQIMQEFGPTDYSAQHPDTYAYGNAYGLQGSQHPGVDWAVGYGTRTTVPVSGVVTVVGNDHGSGYYYKNTMGPSNPDASGEFAIQLDNGDILILGHMSSINVRVGQRLNAGDFIGLSGGSDGAHIHVEYRKKDPTTPSGFRIVDPRAYIR